MDTNPDLDEILGRFSDALAIAETAREALNALQEGNKPIGAAVLTLDRGLSELRRAYTELDLRSSTIAEGAGVTATCSQRDRTRVRKMDALTARP